MIRFFDLINIKDKYNEKVNQNSRNYVMTSLFNILNKLKPQKRKVLDLKKCGG